MYNMNVLPVPVLTRITHSVVIDENGDAVISGNNILLCENATQEVIFIPCSEEICNEFGFTHMIDKSEEQQKEVGDNTTNEEIKIWNRENTLYLINCIQKFENQFSTGIKKNVWQKVSESCQHLHKNLSGKQCETKWKSLLRTYKSILLNNNTSGQKRRYWEFFEIMHNTMYKKPEITPPATCSSLDGLHINKEKQSEENLESSKENKEEQVNQKEHNFESTFSKKRKQKVSEAEKRHREKMQRLDRFNNLFEDMIKKMPEK